MSSAVRVLLLEPEPRTATGLEDAMRACGFEVVLPPSNSQGDLTVSRELLASAHCAVLDCRSDGETLGLIEELARGGELPLLLVMDSADDGLEEEALRQGVEDVLLRPELKGRRLKRAVRNAMHRHRIKAGLTEANKELGRSAVSDPLTGLLNRRGLEAVMERERVVSMRRGVDDHLIFIDLDDFKNINDEGGYDGGDRVLQAVAKALQDVVRQTDHVARIGGDEFLVLLPDSKLASGLRLAERIRKTMERIRVGSDEHPLRVRASFGVSRIDEDAVSITEMVATAGQALHESKRRGKNRVTTTVSDPAKLTPVQGGGSGRLLSQPGRSAGRAPLKHLMPLGMFELVPLLRVGDGSPAGHRVQGPGDGGRGLMATLGERADHDRIAHDLLEIECAVHAVRNWGGRGRVHMPVLPATLLATAPERWNELLPSLKGVAWSVVLHDNQLVGDPSPYVTAVENLREAGIELTLREAGFNRESLEAVVLLRPSVVSVNPQRFVGRLRGRAGVQMLRRLLRLVRMLGADAAVDRPEPGGDAALREAVEQVVGVSWPVADDSRSSSTGS